MLAVGINGMKRIVAGSPTLQQRAGNALTPLTVLATLNIANNILLESGLTFLGLGVDPTIPSWGGMLADGRNYIETAWWVSAFQDSQLP